jgi:hypothetical protein
MDMSWRKSTRSGINGDACVQVATWRKSARSSGNGGNCVEVACVTARGTADRRS